MKFLYLGWKPDDTIGVTDTIVSRRFTGFFIFMRRFWVVESLKQLKRLISRTFHKIKINKKNLPISR